MTIQSHSGKKKKQHGRILRNKVSRKRYIRSELLRSGFGEESVYVTILSLQNTDWQVWMCARE